MSLTKTEFQVARLASFGLSNKEIAHIQHVQSRTVESHLYRAYKKLKVSGKRELPRIFLDDSKSPFLMFGCFNLSLKDKVRMLSCQGLKEERIAQKLSISAHRVQAYLNQINNISPTKAIECKGLKLRLKDWARLLNTTRLDLSYRLRNGEKLSEIVK